MDLDEYQQAWQAQSSQTRITVDADMLLKEVRRNQHVFQAIIARRDLVEVGVSLLLLPVWFYLGIKNSLPWTWYLTVPALLWIAGFMLVYRKRHPPTPGEPDEALVRFVKRSLSEVEDQIWLLRNVFWWYLLPPTISILTFFADVSWRASKNWLEALGGGGFLFVFVLTVYCFIDYINQRAVRLNLSPRRQELLALLASLGDDWTGEHATMNNTKSSESPTVFRRWLIVAVLSLVTFVVATAAMALAGGAIESGYDGPSRSSGPKGDSLAKLVTEQRKEKKLVGLAAMVTIDGQLHATAAHGERKQDSEVPIEITDQWHLGSITKSITATMTARLIESGKMRWSDTVGDVFPEHPVDDDWKPVTLRQLLTHTAGAPANFPNTVLRQRPVLGTECMQARRKAVLGVLAGKPALPPGKQHLYSNVGYTIAGAMAEQMTGESWEDLVKREVFEPLKLTDAGFGPPKSSDEALEQPRGHRTGLFGKVAMDDKADNTPIMGPAGTIHMTLKDLCTYATEHLRGERGAGKLLSTETYKVLHAPELDGYACGWVKKEPSEEIPHTVFWHNGSNTMWYALVVFIPETKMVVAVTSNDGNLGAAEAAAWEIVMASVK